MTEPTPGVFGIVLKDFPRSKDPNVLNTRETLFSYAGKSVLVAKDFAGRTHLLIPIESESGLTHKKDLTQGIRIREVLQAHPATEQITGYLDIECVTPESDQVFGAICHDFCSGLSAQDGSKGSLVEQLVSVLDKWREVLKAMVLKEPTDSEKIGLIGELVVLQGLTLSQGLGAIEAWFGSDRARHDFEFEAMAIEVKSSTSLSANDVTIHGLHQLEITPPASLYLVHLRMERASEGISVDSLTADLLALGVSLEAIEQRVASFIPLGLGEMPSWASEFSVKLADGFLYEVNAKFPRIRPGELQSDVENRIRSIQYRLDLSGLDKVSLHVEDLELMGRQIA